jgi:hypothetical protein
MRCRHLAPAVLVLSIGACMPPSGGPPTPDASGGGAGPSARRWAMTNPIDTSALRGHTFFLASDLLQGRGTGSPGAHAAALYIEAQCRVLGLRPLGDGYMQDVPLDEAHLRADTHLVVRQAADSVTFVPADGFTPIGGTVAALAPLAGELAFVGSATDIREAPDSLPALAGKVAVTIGPVRGSTAHLLTARGAVGLVHLSPNEAAYEAYLANLGTAMTILSDSTIPSSFFPDVPAVLAGPVVTQALVAAMRAGPGATIALDPAFDRHPIAARNVGCLLPGTDARLRDTAIVFTAHYDHLGISVPDEHGDSIYNGFSDNAAGVAMLLAIAEGLRATPPGGLRHAAVFLFFTGEERGLLGSDYFVARPTFPLDRIRAVINLDAGAPPARSSNWRLAGGEGSALGTLGVDVALAHGWSATVSAATPNSDYFPFTRHGVPAVFIVPGAAPYEGLSADSSQALRHRWDRYHQPSDEYHEAFPFTGLQRYAEYAYLIARAADLGEVPAPLR